MGITSVENMIDSITIERIKSICCSYFHTTIDELNSRVRTRDLSDTRKAIAYICKMHLRRVSDDEIGEIIGNRDRSTVCHALKKSKELLESNEQFRFKILSIEKDLDYNQIRKVSLVYDRINHTYKGQVGADTFKLEDLTKEELIYSIQNNTRFR